MDIRAAHTRIIENTPDNVVKQNERIKTFEYWDQFLLRNVSHLAFSSSVRYEYACLFSLEEITNDGRLIQKLSDDGWLKTHSIEKDDVIDIFKHFANIGDLSKSQLPNSSSVRDSELTSYLPVADLSSSLQNRNRLSTRQSKSNRTSKKRSHNEEEITSSKKKSDKSSKPNFKSERSHDDIDIQNAQPQSQPKETNSKSRIIFFIFSNIYLNDYYDIYK